MKVTESQLRSLTRSLLKELFTRKSGLGITSFFGDEDSDVDIDTYGGGDGYDIGEAEEKIEEDSEEE